MDRYRIDEAAAVQYVQDLIKTEKGLLKFVNRAAGVGYTNNKARIRLRVEHVAPFVDLDEFNQLLEPIYKSKTKMAELDSRTREAIESFMIDKDDS